MIDRIKREPVILIGVIFAASYAALSSLAGSGVIGQDIADTIGKAINPEGGWLLPIIAAIITRYFTTPAYAPAVKEGTEVTVITPAGQPNTTVTV